MKKILATLSTLFGVEVAAFGGLTESAFAAHLLDLGANGRRTLALFAVGAFTNAGALPVPRGYADIRDTIAVALTGDTAALTVLSSIVPRGLSLTLLDGVVLAHIAYTLTNAPTATRTNASAPRGSARRDLFGSTN